MRDTALSILLVSDSQDTVADIVTTYTQHSPRSTLNIVHNLVEARAFLSQNTPDIALVRYQLSDGNAPELIDERISSFPLILSSKTGNRPKPSLHFSKVVSITLRQPKRTLQAYQNCCRYIGKSGYYGTNWIKRNGWRN